MSKILNGSTYGKSVIYKFGRNPSVGAAEVLIAEGNVYGLPETAEPIEITSTSGADNPTGDGARSIHISGLDADYEEIEETIIMGQSSVNSYLRVYRAYVETAGEVTPVGGANAGTLTIRQNASLVEMVKIATGDGQTLVACFTVPAGLKALMYSVDVTTGEGKNATARLKSREFNGLHPFRTKGIRDSFQNTVVQKFETPIVYDEKTDIVFTAISSAAGTSVSGTFFMEFVKK